MKLKDKLKKEAEFIVKEGVEKSNVDLDDKKLTKLLENIIYKCLLKGYKIGITTSLNLIKRLQDLK